MTYIRMFEGGKGGFFYAKRSSMFSYLHRMNLNLTEKNNHWIPVSLSAQQYLVWVHKNPHSLSRKQNVTVEKHLKEYV